MGRRARSSRPEDALQRAVVPYVRLAIRPVGGRCFHIPNGGKRSKVEAAILKGLGVMAGVPDVLVLVPWVLPTWFELKAPKKGPTKEQVEFGDAVRAMGHEWRVVRAVDDVIEPVRRCVEEARSRMAVEGRLDAMADVARGVLEELEVTDEVREVAARGRLRGEHFGIGMQVRNALRRAGVVEGLSDQALDEVWAAAVARAVA